MTRIPILLLGLYCLLNSSNQETTNKADCDDPDTFEAVNAVLRSYNDAKEDGNQFALYRITDANIKQENEGLTHYFVTFDIKESVCAVKQDILWQGCDFNEHEDADRGNCTGHVVVNSQQKTKVVLSHSCTSVKVLEPTVAVVPQPCKGCTEQIDTKSQDLSPILQAATEQMTRQVNYPFHFELQDVLKASRQMTLGWNYELLYTIQQTNCSKDTYPNFNLEECKPDINGQGGNCSVKVFVTPNGQIKDVKLNCYLTSGFCLTCPTVVESNDPELQGLLNYFIKQYNSGNNFTNLYKVNNGIKATRKLNGNQKEYDVSFIIQVTNCSNSDSLILGDDCDFQPNGNRFLCEAQMNVANETIYMLQKDSCIVASSKSSRITLKGFSPLRTVTIDKRKRRASHKSKGDGHGQNHKEEKKNKNEMKKDKGKKKHDNKKDRSSEESHEEDRRKPVVPPRIPQFEIPKVPHKDVHVIVPTSKQPLSNDKVPGQPVTQPPTPILPNLSPSLPAIPAIPEPEETFPNIHETNLIDLPVPTPASIPKCPGKLWQPLRPDIQIPTEIPFVIPGVLKSTFDDLTPPDVQDELPDENQPNVLSGIDLSDAVASS